MAEGTEKTSIEGSTTDLGDAGMSTESRVRPEDEESLREVRKHLIKTIESPFDILKDDDKTYVEPVPDPHKKAIKYLEQHNILQIFQAMTSNIVYQRPENPIDFMISEIEEMKKAQGSSETSKPDTNA